MAARRLLALGLLARLCAAFQLAPLPGGGRLKVAYAIFVTDLDSPAWQDAMAVMAYSLKKVKAKSRHDATSLVLAPDRMPDKQKDMLLSFGFDEVVRRPPPVRVAEIQTAGARNEMGHTQGTEKGTTFALEEETIKYWGMAQTQFDRVLVLDADTLVLDPMDELMELPEDFAGVYDHGLDCCGSRVPPVQGGFLLMRPNATDFEAIKALTREGDFGGGGWKKSGVGYWYGGVGPDGLLAYYFNKDALAHLPKVQLEGHRELAEGIDKPTLRGSRMKAVDPSVYDVLLVDRLVQDLKAKGADMSVVGSHVKAAHFTGDCLKPWSCWRPDQTKPGSGLCSILHDKWWQLWTEVAAQRASGGSSAVSGAHCEHGGYKRLPEM